MDNMDCQDESSETPGPIEKVLALILKNKEVLNYLNSTGEQGAEIVELFKEYKGDVEQWLKALKVEAANSEASEQKNRTKKIEQVLGLLLKNPEIPSILLNSDSKDSAPLWEAMIEGAGELNELLEEFEVDVDQWCFVDKNTQKKLAFSNWLTSSDEWQSKRKMVEALIKIGAENTKPLENAVRKENIDCLKFLLQNRAHINPGSVTKLLFKNPKKPKRKEILKLLIEHDEELLNEIWASEGETLLNYVSKLGNEFEDVVEIAETLIDAKDPIQDKHGDNNGNYPLHNAIEKQNIELISLLLKKGANPNRPPYVVGGKTPLILAVQFDNLDMINLLLSGGARINDKTEHDEMTALHGACICLQERIINLLLQKGANISAVNAYGSTALSILLENPEAENSDRCILTMVKEFSKRSFKDLKIFKQDMDLIQTNAKVQEQFDNCKKELAQISNTVLHDSLTYYSVLNLPKNSRKLVPLTKNEELASQFKAFTQGLFYYDSDLQRIWENQV